MPPQIDPLSLWAILRIQEGFFAVPCDQVQSIIELTDVTPVPNLPQYLRGIIHYQNQIVYLIDLRNRLSLPSLTTEIDEFVELMNAREQDHINWLNTLQECVNEGKKFTLATDPKKCKFGQWYYKNLPEIRDEVLKSILEKFEKPHNNIHGIATHIEKLMNEGKIEEATRLIDTKKDYELRRMINLFGEAKRIHRSHHKEITIILKNTDRLFALIVDEVVGISTLSWDHWQSIEEMMGYDEKMDFMLGIAETLDDGSPVTILNLPRLSG